MLCRHVRRALSRLEKEDTAEKVVPIEVIVSERSRPAHVGIHRLRDIS